MSYTSTTTSAFIELTNFDVPLSIPLIPFKIATADYQND
jgi:hypothetical protein